MKQLPVIVFIFIASGFVLGACYQADYNEPEFSNSRSNSNQSRTNYATLAPAPTQPPTFTPDPCQWHAVSTWSAAVRECPSTDCLVVTTIEKDVNVCALGRAPDARDWFVVQIPGSRQRGYMHETVLGVNWVGGDGGSTGSSVSNPNQAPPANQPSAPQSDRWAGCPDITCPNFGSCAEVLSYLAACP